MTNLIVMLFGSMIAVFCLSIDFLKKLGSDAPYAYMLLVGMFYTFADILLIISDAITAGNRAMLGLLLKTAAAALVTMAVYLLPDGDRELSEGEAVLVLVLMSGFFYMLIDVLSEAGLFLSGLFS